jgi:hypothetical protein
VRAGAASQHERLQSSDLLCGQILGWARPINETSLDGIPSPVPRDVRWGERAEFAGSRFPDLRTADTAYVDLAAALLTARGTDGYQTVWFHQRLSAARAKQGR